MSAKESNFLPKTVPVNRETLHEQLNGTYVNQVRADGHMWGWNALHYLFEPGYRWVLNTACYGAAHNGNFPLKGPDGYEGDKKSKKEALEEVPAHILARDAKVYPKQEFETDPKYTFKGAPRVQHEGNLSLMMRAWSGPKGGTCADGGGMIPRFMWEFYQGTPLALLAGRWANANNNYSRMEIDSHSAESHLYKTLYARPGQNSPCHPVTAPSTDRDMRGEVRTDNFRFPKSNEPGFDGQHPKLEKQWQHQDNLRNINKQNAARYQAAKQDNQASGGMVALPGALTWEMNRNQGVTREDNQGEEEK